MLLVKYQIALLLHHVLDCRKHWLPGEVRHARRLLDICELYAGGAEELAVGLHGCWEAACEPVERDVCEDGVERGGLVGPFEELFADPEFGCQWDDACGLWSIKLRI